MKSYKMVKASVAAALAMGVIGINAPISTEANGADFSLTILHTNDTHAALKDAPKRATLVQELRAEAGNENSLLLDAGDVFSGSLYFNEFGGQADLELMNYMGYDAMTFGNHEFDLGLSEDGHQALADFVAGADFPFVSANVDFSGDAKFDGLQNDTYTDMAEDGQIYNGMIKEIDGEKVGIFGLTTEETINISSTEAVDITDYIAAAEEAVAAFETAGVNKIVAVTHLGYNDSAVWDNDMLLAQSVAGIDVVVGGHTHTALMPPAMLTNEESGDPVVIVQAGSNGSLLGELDVTFDDMGVITSHVGEHHKVSDAVADPTAVEILAPYKEVVDAKGAESIGAYAEVFLNGTRDMGGVRTSETNLGNLVADGMLAKAQEIDPETVIAVQNGGGIRNSIDVGDITYGEVLSVMPFGNSLAIMDLTGAELLAALEVGVSSYPSELGSFLHVSGLEFVFDPSKPAGERVVDANVVTEDGLLPISEDENYKVATNTYIATGKDGFTSFGEAYEDGRVSEPGFVDYEMFIDYVTSLDMVWPLMEGRITTVLPYTDVNLLDWEYPYVNDLFSRNVMTGTTTNTFSPDNTLPRWQLASMMVRLLDLPTEDIAEEDKAPFTDIADLPAARQNEIHALYAAGLINGTTETTFSPRAFIKRSHFALMVDNVFTTGYFESAEETVEYPFSDVSHLPEVELEAIWNMYSNGIISGYPNGTFKPGATTTRAEAARIISMFAPYVKYYEAD